MLDISWSRAVWFKGSKVYEDTVPTKWIENGTLYWPVGVNALQASKESRDPESNWKKIKLKKVKVTDGM